MLKQVKLLAKSGVFSRDGNRTEHTKVEPHSNVIPNWTNWKSLTTEPEPNRTIRLRHRTRTLHSVFDSHSQYDQRGANCYVGREWVVYWCDWFALNSLVWRLCCFLLAGTSAPSNSTVLTVSADCMVLHGIAVTVYQTEVMQVLVENLYGPKSLFTICSWTWLVSSWNFKNLFVQVRWFDFNAFTRASGTEVQIVCMLSSWCHCHPRAQSSLVSFISRLVLPFFLPSVLWHCWLGGRKGIRPVKNLSSEVLAWLSVWSEVQTCILYGPADTTAAHCLLLQ